MCRWIAYAGAPRALEDFVFDQKMSLIEQSRHARKSKTEVNGDGFGIGWYGRGEQPGLFRDVLPAWSDANLRSLCEHIVSPIFIAHIRAATGTATNRQNCHPFVKGRYMFAHNGQVGGYCRVRRALETLLPDALYHYRQGTTDSEILFLLLVHYCESMPVIQAMERLIKTVNAVMDAARVVDAFRFTSTFSDGHELWAIRYASDHKDPSLYYADLPGGAIVVSEPLDDDKCKWQAVAANHVVRLDGCGQVTIQALQQTDLDCRQVPIVV